MSEIIPAILTNDLQDADSKLLQLHGLSDWVQFDIMDRSFVNNTSFRLEDLATVESLKDFNVEIHLLVYHPEKYFEICEKIGAKRVIFHHEATNAIEEVLNQAKNFDFEIGIALNPVTSVEKIQPILNQISFVTIMSVNPGFQGQEFIPSALDKVKNLKRMISEIHSVKSAEGGVPPRAEQFNRVKIEVDGGINLGNIKSVADSGADYLVVGSGLWKNKNVKESLKNLQEQIK